MAPYKDEHIREALSKLKVDMVNASQLSALASANASTIPGNTQSAVKSDEKSILEDFLEKYLEGYLLGDLETMATKLPLYQHPGGVGYPMVSPICSGIEFLGMLLRPKGEADFDPDEGTKYFGHYWKNYLSRQKVDYKPYGNLVRELVRNGLSHLFLTKKHIGITRTNPELHLKILNDHLIINCILFYEDFRDSYFNLAKPALLDNPTNTHRAAVRLKTMMDLYSRQSDAEFSKLKK